MSSYTYRNDEKGVEILIGWEKVRTNLVTGAPVGGGFFMVVYDPNSPRQTSDRPAFSNLDQPDPYPGTLEPYLQHLEDHWGVTLPAELIDRLETDKVADL